MLKCGTRELDLVKTYTGHERDSVLGQYYAKARMYDTADKHGSSKGNKLGDKRFTAVDPVKGNVRNPQSLVQYTYVLNNPLMYVDPLGMFAQGDILELGSGKGIFTSKQEKEDVVWLKLRLISDGYLDIDDAAKNWKVIDEKTIQAVNKYKDKVGLTNTGKYRGKIGATTWEHLGLEFGEINPSSRFVYIEDLERKINAILFKVENVLLDSGDGLRYYNKNLLTYTYAGEYYDKYVCAVGRSEALKDIGRIGTAGQNFMEIMSNNPFTHPGIALGGAVLLTYTEEKLMYYYTDSERYIPGVGVSDLTGAINKLFAEPAIQKASNQFDAIVKSSAKNILSPRQTYDAVNRQIIEKWYLNRMSTLAYAENDNKSYIESLMYLSIGWKGANDYLKDIL